MKQLNQDHGVEIKSIEKSWEERVELAKQQWSQHLSSAADEKLSADWVVFFKKKVAPNAISFLQNDLNKALVKILDEVLTDSAFKNPTIKSMISTRLIKHILQQMLSLLQKHSKTTALLVDSNMVDAINTMAQQHNKVKVKDTPFDAEQQSGGAWDKLQSQFTASFKINFPQLSTDKHHSDIMSAARFFVADQLTTLFTPQVYKTTRTISLHDKEIKIKDIHIANNLIDDENFEIYATGCGGYGTVASGQHIVTAGMEHYIDDSHTDHRQRHIVFTGDNIYPVGKRGTTDADLDGSIGLYETLCRATQTSGDAIGGNHECGAIGAMHWIDSAHGEPEKLIGRRNHIAKLINSRGAISAYPYFRRTYTIYGKAVPEIEIIYFDTSTWHLERRQQAWVKTVMSESQAKHKIGVVHHAIGDTVGKRQFTEDESRQYGKYYRLSDNKFITGNQHQICAEICKDLGIYQLLTEFTWLCAHEHLLAYFASSLGQVVFTGGGALCERSATRVIVRGQKFPAIKLDPALQPEENKRAKMAGFVKLTIMRDSKKPNVALIDIKGNTIFESSKIPETKPLPNAQIKRFVKKILQPYITSLSPRRIHRGRMHILLNNIDKAQSLTEMQAYLQADYSALQSALGLSLMPKEELSCEYTRGDKTFTVASRAYQHPSRGIYLQSLNQALVYLSSLQEEETVDETAHYSI